MTRLPDFIIIGAMKSATTTLHAQLRAQPGLFMCEPKEPSFFSDDDVYARGVQWYASLFAKAPAGALCGESSTHYTKLPTYPDTVRRLREHLPAAKLIYVMRHPIDRLVSQYIHEWSQGRVTAPIDQALDELPELVDYSRYAMQLEPYLETFGPAAVLPVFFERVRGHGPEQLQRICRFLGHDGEPAWVEQEARANVSSRRERPSRLRDGLRRVPGLRPVVRATVPLSLREKLRGRLWRMHERPRISDERRAALEATLDADLARLGRWLDVELCCRNFRAQVDRASFQWRSEPTKGKTRRRTGHEDHGSERETAATAAGTSENHA